MIAVARTWWFLLENLNFRQTLIQRHFSFDRWYWLLLIYNRLCFAIIIMHAPPCIDFLVWNHLDFRPWPLRKSFFSRPACCWVRLTWMVISSHSGESTCKHARLWKQKLWWWWVWRYCAMRARHLLIRCGAVTSSAQSLASWLKVLWTKTRSIPSYWNLPERFWQPKVDQLQGLDRQTCG